MLVKFRGPGPPMWGPVALVFFMVASLVCGEKNKNYTMESLCRDTKLQSMYRKIDGATLISQNEKGLDCSLIFQTHTVLQRFMLRFDKLQLDCNDHLLIYDGSHASGQSKADLSCRNTESNVGAIMTTTNYVTLKYVTDSWGTDQNGFHLVVTAFKDKNTGCKDFRCHQHEFCISLDLLCDRVNHCADGSDEMFPTTCSASDSGSIFGVSLPILVVVIISLLLIIAACGVAIKFGLCRSSPLQSTPSHAQDNMHQMYSGSNGTGQIHIHKSSPTTGTTVISPMTVNWAHPVVLGYLVVWSRLYCQAE